MDFFFFLSKLFHKNFTGIPSVSNSLDPDQARHFVGPDISPNCLQRLSADNKCCQWQGKNSAATTKNAKALLMNTTTFAFLEKYECGYALLSGVMFAVC